MISIISKYRAISNIKKKIEVIQTVITTIQKILNTWFLLISISPSPFTIQGTRRRFKKSSRLLARNLPYIFNYPAISNFCD
jgi:hypothetical protein